MKKQLLFAFGAAALLASCSNDIDTPSAENLYDGYLHVKGTINEVKTRANDNGFEANDKIGISGGIFSNVAYEYSSDSFTAVDDQITVSDDNLDLTAYYPYTESLTGSDEISFNLTDSEKHDYLFATGSASRTTPQVTFQFSHKMAQVSLKVVDETKDNVLNDQKGTITLKNVATTGTFNTKTGAVSAGTADQSITVSEVEASTTSDEATEYTVILPSYTSNDQEISVILAINDKTYSGKIKPALAAGTKYTYTLTISDTSSDPDLTISGAQVSGWTPGDSEDIAMAEDYVLQVGDFLLNTGKTVAPTAKNASEYSAQIIGVVYHVGNSLPENADGYDKDTNDVLYKDFYKSLIEGQGFDWAEHGLALAITNAYEAGEKLCTKANFDLKEDENCSEWFTSNSANYLDLYTASENSFKTPVIRGYNNTKFLSDNATALAEKTATNGYETILSKLSDFDSEYSLTQGSGWYIPSLAELMLWQKDMEAINKSLNLISGAEKLKIYEEYVGSNTGDTNELYYWSSDLATKNLAWGHPMKEGDIARAYRVYVRDRTGWFRFAIAF